MGSTTGWTLAGGNKTNMGHGGKVGVPASGQGNVVGVAQGGGDIHPPPPEHCGTVYCDSSDTGAMPDSGTVAGITGILTVVGAGWY